MFYSPWTSKADKVILDQGRQGDFRIRSSVVSLALNSTLLLTSINKRELPWLLVSLACGPKLGIQFPLFCAMFWKCRA